ELVHQTRIDQYRVDGDRALVEVDDAERVQVEADQVFVAFLQDQADAPEDGDAVALVLADLVEHRELEIDYHRGAPVDLHQRAEEVAAAFQREESRQAAQHLTDAMQRVPREQDVAQHTAVELLLHRT